LAGIYAIPSHYRARFNRQRAIPSHPSQSETIYEKDDSTWAWHRKPRVNFSGSPSPRCGIGNMGRRPGRSIISRSLSFWAMHSPYP